MGRRQTFLLLLVLCVFASFVSAQTVSVTFLDEWGNPAVRVLEQGKALLRVIDPAADTSPARDSVAVELATAIALDTDFTTLEETGEATGVFEGEVDLTTDYSLSSADDESYLLTQARLTSPYSLDTATATYGGVSDSVEAAQSLTDLLDETGASPAGFAVGETVRVRVRDRYADRRSGPDAAMATVSTSGGDSETLILAETGGHTGVFEVSIPSGAGAPVSEDGRIQAAPGQTVSVTHSDLNGFSSSSDSAAFTTAAVRFLDSEGGPADLYLDGAKAIVRAFDVAANTDPYTFQTVSATGSMQLSGDTETISLQETGPDTGVFEGGIALLIGYPFSGDGRLSSQPVTSPTSPFDTVHVSYSGVADSAGLTGSVTRLLDEEGEEAGSFALGSTVRIRVEMANDSPFVDSTFVEVRSLATGDLEILELPETSPASNVFEGSIAVAWSSAESGDGSLQADAGETLRVDHPDANGYTRSRAEAAVARSAVRFVDAQGRTMPVLLEKGTARVRVTDLISESFNEPVPVEVSARLSGDSELLSLTEALGNSIDFEGSVPMTDLSSPPGDGILATTRVTVPLHETDTVTASSNGATAEASTAPAILQFVDSQGEPVTSAAAGSLLRVRASSALANSSPSSANTMTTLIGSYRGEYSRYLFLTETGANTGIFEGTVQTKVGFGSPGPDGLRVAPRDSVIVAYNAAISTGEEGREASALLDIVPVSVELVNGEGEPVSAYLFGETVHVRVTETAANADPALEESVVATVQTRRHGDGGTDVELVPLLETGPDTGVFSGSLPTALISSGSTPSQGDGVLELLNVYPPYGDLATITATRGEASDTASTQDSRLRLTDFAGQDADFFPAGGRAYVRLQRPAGDTTAGVDTEAVGVWTSDDADSDFELLTLVETGSETGIFTGSIAIAPAPVNSDDGILQGDQGVVFHVEKAAFDTIRSADTGMINGFESGGPVAVDDSAEAYEDTPVNVAVMANDTDGDGDPLTVTAVTPGANGHAAIEADGTVTYTPNLNFNGTDSFIYTLSDGTGIDTATVTVSVAAANDPPVAVDDSVTTNEDTPVNFPVLGNDSDPEGSSLSVVAVTQGTKGSVVINQSPGTFHYLIYTPNANATGGDSFTYLVSDGQGGGTFGTVTVTITPVNDIPDAIADSIATSEDIPVTFDPRANDTDADGDLLTVTSVSDPNRGSAAINPDGTVTYTPDAGLSGTDLFVYSISDGQGGTHSAAVTVDVALVNDPPVAVDDSATTNEDTAINFPVKNNDSDPDGDTLSVVAVTQGTKGSVVINQSPGAFHYLIYTPNANANGSDSFTYTISDGHATATATVSMTITPVNDAPDAVADSITTPEDTPVTFNPRTNDTDADGDTLTITSVNGGTRGTPVLNADGTITYTPMPNVSGTDFIQYHISDGHGGTDSALATIVTTPVNDPPVANNDIPNVQEDTPVTINVLANDSDIDGDVLTVTLLTQPANGTAVLNPDKTVTYTPNPNYSGGTDTFTYQVSDGKGGTDPATVFLNVIPVNDPPVANADTATVAEEGTVTVSVLANDTDPENSTLTLVSATQGAHGTVTLLAGNQVQYQPAANYFGPDSFTYTVRDPANLTATGTVNVTVTNVNDPPLAGPDSAATNESTPVTVSVLANDTDIDSGALSVSAVTQGSNGAVTTNGTTVTYTPAAGFNGSDSFTYNVSDGIGGGGGTATGLVTVTVAAVNDAPVANPDSATTREGVAVVIPVLANDTDPEGDTLTVTAVAAPGVLLPDNTVRYTPGANFTGTAIFGYTVSDGQTTANGQVTVVVGEALERVAVLATNSVALRSGSDVLSGDVVVNQASAGPYLNGAELSVGSSVTTPANWDVEADSLTVALGAVVGSDVSYNQLTNLGTINGQPRTPLALPVFPALPAFLAASPGTTNVNVANNGTTTLAPGSYQDLVVGRKGTVNFTGGVYHFRSITVDREAKLLFSAASQVRVQQKLGTKNLTTVGPAAAAPIDASSIVFYVAGINGTTGALSATPKAVEIGTNNTVAVNFYAPNGTAWLQDGTAATGAFLGKDIDVGANVQVTLDSAFN